MTPEFLEIQNKSRKMTAGDDEARRESAREIIETARALRAEAKEKDLGFIVYLLEMVIVEAAEYLEAAEQEDTQK